MPCRAWQHIEIPETVLCQVVQNETVLLDASSEQFFVLNETGTLAWEMLAGGSSRDKVISALCTEYEVDAKTAASDLDLLAEELGTRGLVRLVC